ncbi:hypothetical protein MMC28_007119 [Mycoblastus sanguinarius]|nr:hypothetical protein [Mycoblastus sanguinarius]
MSGSRLPKAQKMTTDSSPRSDSISLDAKTPRITYSCSPKPVDLLRCADSPIEYEWTADIAKFFTPGTKKLVKLLKDLDLYDGIVPHELLDRSPKFKESIMEHRINYQDIMPISHDCVSPEYLDFLKEVAGFDVASNPTNSPDEANASSEDESKLDFLKRGVQLWHHRKLVDRAIDIYQCAKDCYSESKDENAWDTIPKPIRVENIQTQNVDEKFLPKDPKTGTVQNPKAAHDKRANFANFFSPTHPSFTASYNALPQKDQRLRTKDTGGRRSVEVSATGGEDNREMSEMDTKDNKASQPDKGNDIPEPPVVGWMVIGHEWELHIGIWNIDETRIVRTAPGSEDLKTTALTTTRGSIVHLSFGERLGIYWVY